MEIGNKIDWREVKNHGLPKEKGYYFIQMYGAQNIVSLQVITDGDGNLHYIQKGNGEIESKWIIRWIPVSEMP